MTMNELKILAAVALAVVLGASAAPQETAGGLRYFTRAALESADTAMTPYKSMTTHILSDSLTR